MNLLQMIAENLDGVSTEGLDIRGVDGDVLEILQTQGLIEIRNNKVICPYKVGSYGEYLMKVFLACPPEQRLGQWALNLFVEKFPSVDVTEDLDPFYNDSLLGEFLEFVSEYKHDF